MSFNFQKLTPINDAELNIYEDAFYFIFDNDDVRNIAVSGAYCAGKSSILESYKAAHKEHKFLNISLAHFETNDNTKKDDNKEFKTTQELKIEAKIINQLIHQIPYEKIPNTNFKIKNNITSKKVFFMSFKITLFIISCLCLMFSAHIKDFFSLFISNNIAKYICWGLNTMSFLVCFCLLTLFLMFLIKEQANRKLIHRLNINGNEFELLGEQNDSYFDKFLNEVLYLFENVDADAIVFEDLDRFNLGIIFERLREINTLANIKLKAKNKSLKFFYLIRDDIFESKDRTKFFDFIMPIVPIIDNSNSYNKFKDIVENGHREEKFDDEFLIELSKYVDDMRILKNIYNEYLFYYELLHIEPDDCNKMLAMSTYKNIFPKDFSELQLGRGYVFHIFQEKNENMQVTINNLQNEKSGKITTIKSLNEYLKSPHVISGYHIEEVIANKKIELEKATIELNELEENIKKLEINTLSSLLQTGNWDILFQYNEANNIKNSQYLGLLKFLLIKGYISEDYNRYMTYSYTNE